MKKQILAIFLALVMIFTLLPVSALADEQASDQPAAELPEAVDGVITLEEDVTISDATAINTETNKNMTYDLNGHTLTYTGIASIEVTKGQVFTIKDSSVSGSTRGGTFEITGLEKVTDAAVNVKTGGTVNINNINVVCNASAFFPQGDAAAVNITDSNVKAVCYCVGTNAAEEDNYKVKIALKNSKFTAVSEEDADNCPVMINVKGTLDIENCDIKGQRQGMMVRAGTATITNSSITTTGDYKNAATKYHTGPWSSGNEVPAAALTVGNYVDGKAGSYCCDATVTLNNSTVTGTDKVPAIYADANASYKATVSIDAATRINGEIKEGQYKEGQIFITRDVVVPPSTPEPEVTENPDGSVTETETAADGTVTATTTWEDGQQAVAVKTPEGEKEITVTAAGGETMAAVEIPAEPAESKEFEDVQDDGWYKDSVDKATGYGLFEGTSETTFSPETAMNRGMLATVFYNLSGQTSYGVGTGTFDDVADGAYYADPVDWAAAVGVTNGKGDGFDPDGSVTREQLVTMLYRYAKLIGAAGKDSASLEKFPDADKVSGYAQEAMAWAVANGFIAGRASGDADYIAPQGDAKRSEVAAVLVRFVEYLKK